MRTKTTTKKKIAKKPSALGRKQNGTKVLSRKRTATTGKTTRAVSR